MKFYGFSCVLVVLLLQGNLMVSARPSLCGSSFGECDGGCGGGLGYGGGFGFGGAPGFGGCGPVPISPPISFAPVPQPVPIRIPAPRPQSVTIPNIILALLPPNNKPVNRRPQIISPPPMVLPLPQPCPLPIGGGCGFGPLIGGECGC